MKNGVLGLLVLEQSLALGHVSHVTSQACPGRGRAARCGVTDAWAGCGAAGVVCRGAAAAGAGAQ